MKKYTLTVTVCIGLIGGGLFIRWLAQPPKDALEDAFLNNRNWVDVTFEPQPLPHFDHNLLLNPVELRVYESGIYISDAGHTKIKRFDFDGRFLNEIGYGQGQGPGEFEYIMDFDVDGRDLWITDSQTRQITHFSIEGDFYDRFGVIYHPVRIHRIGGGVVVKGTGRVPLFELFDEKGETKREFGQFFENQRPDDGIVLSGYMTSWQNGGFIFVPKHASKLYYYSSTGELNTEVVLIDGRPDILTEIRIRSTAGQTMFIAPDTRHLIYPAGIDEGGLYLLCGLKFFGEDPKIQTRPSRITLDRYDWATGQYQWSTEVPDRADEMWVFGNKLYVIAGDTTLVAYDMILED